MCKREYDEVIVSLRKVENVVVTPCGDAFVCNGLYQEMSHHALRRQEPLKGRAPGSSCRDEPSGQIQKHPC